MKKEEIISKLKKLNFPENSYIVFGSCPLAVAGIRDAQDIDLFVSKEMALQLRDSGWREIAKSPDNKSLTHDVFEAYDNWNFSSYTPTLGQLLATATIIDGVPFVSLEEVKNWKTVSGRPKDLADIALIDKYLEPI
ncbi:MAG TPA: hypothetical protein VNG29_03610 [Candidatus Paceibacterota bacterium]|nr:hypothetical protein [Candidatus Paceibacterota bacterium]